MSDRGEERDGRQPALSILHTGGQPNKRKTISLLFSFPRFDFNHSDSIIDRLVVFRLMNLTVGEREREIK